MNQKDNGPRYKADDLKLRYNSIFTVPQRQLELEQRERERKVIRMNALYDKGKEEVNRFGFVPCIEYLIGEVPNPDFIVIPSHLEKRIIDDLKRYKSEQSNP